MESTAPGTPASKKLLVAGWILTLLPVLGFLFSGVMKLVNSPDVRAEFTKLGWGEGLAFGIGIVELVCTVIYLFPRTAVLGAILLTGYLGGAVATHVRISDPFVPPIIMGILIWGGLYLRDERVRALVPLRK